MPRYVLNVTTFAGPPTGNVTQRFFVTADTVRLALARLFNRKPAFDVATNLALNIAEVTDEDLT